jgi:hypothetical protein
MVFGRRCGLDLFGLGYKSIEDFCENDNEPSYYTSGRDVKCRALHVNILTIVYFNKARLLRSFSLK